jgi:hypothetical protein
MITFAPDDVITPAHPPSHECSLLYPPPQTWAKLNLKLTALKCKKLFFVKVNLVNPLPDGPLCPPLPVLRQNVASHNVYVTKRNCY